MAGLDSAALNAEIDADLQHGVGRFRVMVCQIRSGGFGGTGIELDLIGSAKPGAGQVTLLGSLVPDVLWGVADGINDDCVCDSGGNKDIHVS